MLILFPATFNLFVVSRFTRPTFPPLPLTGGGGGGGCSPVYPPEQLSLSSVLTYPTPNNTTYTSPVLTRITDILLQSYDRLYKVL